MKVIFPKEVYARTISHEITFESRLNALFLNIAKRIRRGQRVVYQGIRRLAIQHFDKTSLIRDH